MPKKWTMIFLIWLMMFVAYLDRINISIAGPIMMKELHMSPAIFGATLSAFTFGYALLQIPGGWLADRIGSRTLLITALIWWSLFTGFTGLVTSAGALIAVRVLFGVGEGLENGAQFKLIADFFTTRQRSLANGIFLTAIALGPAFVAPVSTWLLARVGWQGLFLWFTIPGFIMAFLIWRFIPRLNSTEVVHDAPNLSSPAISWKSALQGPKLWLVFFAYLFFNMAFWGYLGWMPSYLSMSRHLNLAALGFDAAVPYIAGFFGLLIIGWVGNRLPQYKAIIIAASYFISGIFLYQAYNVHTISSTIWGLSLAAFFLFGGFGPIWALPMDLIPEKNRGALTGFINFGGQIGGFVAPLTVGIIVTATHSFSGGFLFMILALVLAAICLVILQSLTRRAVRSPHHSSVA